MTDHLRRAMCYSVADPDLILALDTARGIRHMS